MSTRKSPGLDEPCVALERSCLSHQVRRVVLNRILDGSYPPGTRLKELPLAREFGVSQAPVREAFRELETLGILVSEHYRGTSVRSPELDDLREAYELRLLLEEAAARGAVPCKESDLAELEFELKHMHMAELAADYNLLPKYGQRFHRKIIEMCGNRMFLRVWDSQLWEVRMRIAGQYLWGAGGPSVDELNRPIISALRSGDADAAAIAVRAFIKSNLQRLEAIDQPEALNNKRSAAA